MPCTGESGLPSAHLVPASLPGRPRGSGQAGVPHTPVCWQDSPPHTPLGLLSQGPALLPTGNVHPDSLGAPAGTHTQGL